MAVTESLGSGFGTENRIGTGNDAEEMHVETHCIDVNEDSNRDEEKRDALAKQREKYLSQEPRAALAGGGTGVMHGLRRMWDAMFSNIDSHNEKLYYLLIIELFFIFLTYTHYPYFDNKNKFLTPIVMGGETSLLGETITQLRRCITMKQSYLTHSMPMLANDEESIIYPRSVKAATSGGMHTRNSSNVNAETLLSPNITPSPLLSPTSTSTNRGHVRNISSGGKSLEREQVVPLQLRDRDREQELKELTLTNESSSVRDHLKHLTWGGLNGLLSSYWIELVITLFPSKKYACVLLDQTVGTVIFQTLYTLFICVWDAEIEVSPSTSATRTTAELTGESFAQHYGHMLWKYMKISWLMWPFVSVVSFTLLPPGWIFPVNCVSATVFTVLLGM